MRDGETNRLMAAVTKIFTSLIVAVNEWWLIYFITRFLQRTATRNELLTNYSDCVNETLTNSGLESLEKVK